MPQPPYTSELWLDIMAPSVRNITKQILDYAKAKGCDAVGATKGGKTTQPR